MSVGTENIIGVSSKNSEQLLKNLQNTTGDYFFAAPCTLMTYMLLYIAR